MPSPRQSLVASALLAATGIVLLAFRADQLWSAFVFVLSVVFLVFYLRATYLLLRGLPTAPEEAGPGREDPPGHT